MSGMPCRMRASRKLFARQGLRRGWNVAATVAGGLVCLAVLAAASAAEKADPAAPQEQLSGGVAFVNGEEITREQLAQDCMLHHGSEVLETLINHHLIAHECQRRNVSVTSAEVDAEIEGLASRFNLPVEQWLKMLKQERGIKPQQYANDIIWPRVALRKLAGERLQVTPQELQEEFQSEYGPSVRARIIACDTQEEARRLRQMAVADPTNFGNLAKNFSKDPSSASLKGMIQPIHHGMSDKQVEQAAFSMRDGDISDVIPVGRQFVILEREALLPAPNVTIEQVQERLKLVVRERKIRSVANDVFRDLRQQSKIEILFGDPQRQSQRPDVAAIVNGVPLSTAQLAAECIQRYGDQILEGSINRRLLEQACRKARITISDQDLQQEIAEVAARNLKPTADGKPDVANWLKLVTRKEGLTLDVYVHDAVWPSVALKKLAGDRVVITQEDLQKAFQANYGPRVRCRAIVLSNQRLAQKVWEMARRDPSVEFFGKLAEQYSVEASSRALQGEVPPIRKFGGQPKLEQEAFALKPGELSSIIQADDKFIILLCEGQTVPVPVDIDHVRDELTEDIRDKKLHLAVAQYFEELQQQATIDNVLAGTTRKPKEAGSSASGDVRPVSHSEVAH